MLVYYQCLNKDINDDFFYDEEKKKHCHQGNTAIYFCYCSNGHKWHEYSIYKCNSCDWRSSDKFKKLYEDNQVKNIEDEDLSFISLYIMSLLFPYV